MIFLILGKSRFPQKKFYNINNYCSNKFSNSTTNCCQKMVRPDLPKFPHFGKMLSLSSLFKPVSACFNCLACFSYINQCHSVSTSCNLFQPVTTCLNTCLYQFKPVKGCVYTCYRLVVRCAKNGKCFLLFSGVSANFIRAPTNQSGPEENSNLS